MKEPTYPISVLREGIRKYLDEGVPWPDALALIFWDCQDLGLRVSVEYDNGMFQSPGESLGDWQEPRLDESKRGYSITISGYYIPDDDGVSEKRFPTMAAAVGAGLVMLDSILEKKEGGDG